MEPTSLWNIILLGLVHIWHCTGLEVTKMFLPREKGEGGRLTATYNNDEGYTLQCMESDGVYGAFVFYRNTRVATIYFGPCSPISTIQKKLAFVMENKRHGMKTFADKGYWSVYRFGDENPGQVDIRDLYTGVARTTRGAHWRYADEGEITVELGMDGSGPKKWLSFS